MPPLDAIHEMMLAYTRFGYAPPLAIVLTAEAYVQLLKYIGQRAQSTPDGRGVRLSESAFSVDIYPSNWRERESKAGIAQQLRMIADLLGGA